MKCPDCGHEAEKHGFFGGIYCSSGKCQCLITEKNVYLALLNEARQVIAPFAKVADDWFPELSEDNEVKTIVGSNENLVTIGQFRKAVSFLAKIGNGDME